MAKILLLVSLLLYVTVAEAAPVLAEWGAAANKRISDMQSKVDEALKDVVAAAPPAKRSEAKKTALRYKNGLSVILSKAKGRGDEKKAISIAGSYEKAAEKVIAAPASSKLQVMETTFSAAAAPDGEQCPNVDKSYCVTFSKFEEANLAVLSAAPPAKFQETMSAGLEIAYDGLRNINKAYATGDDEKEIARVLAAYNKAADAVIAAAPAEKLKVMEETFTAANKA